MGLVTPFSHLVIPRQQPLKEYTVVIAYFQSEVRKREPQRRMVSEEIYLRANALTIYASSPRYLI